MVVVLRLMSRFPGRMAYAIFCHNHFAWMNYLHLAYFFTYQVKDGMDALMVKSTCCTYKTKKVLFIPVKNRRLTVCIARLMKKETCKMQKSIVAPFSLWNKCGLCLSLIRGTRIVTIIAERSAKSKKRSATASPVFHAPSGVIHLNTR